MKVSPGILRAALPASLMLAAGCALPAPPRAGPPAQGFSIHSYGRMAISGDGHGRPGRDADIVAHGSRLDEGSYVELGLQRDDRWAGGRAQTRLVATLAAATPFFHYDSQFAARIAVRNLYLEASALSGARLSVWAGSRMYRGDDIYLLDYWPLDNLNTVGGGARAGFGADTSLALHAGVNQPATDFYVQQVTSPSPLDPGGAMVKLLDRQKLIASLKLTHLIHLGARGGLKLVAYGEVHQISAGERRGEGSSIEALPADLGGVAGAQIGAFSGVRDTHVNLFLRYARGLAAYGEMGTPSQLAADGTTSGARELLIALGGNVERGPFGLMLGAYARSFRDASPARDAGDVDEAMIAARPHLFFGELGGVAIEGSVQAARRGAQAPRAARVIRLGIIPFLSPAGRGDYARPQIRLIYVISARDAAARALYPQDDVFHARRIDHFLGFGAEWWFSAPITGG